MVVVVLVYVLVMFFIVDTADALLAGFCWFAVIGYCLCLCVFTSI